MEKAKKASTHHGKGDAMTLAGSAIQKSAVCVERCPVFKKTFGDIDDEELVSACKSKFRDVEDIEDSFHKRAFCSASKMLNRSFRVAYATMRGREFILIKCSPMEYVALMNEEWAEFLASCAQKIK